MTGATAIATTLVCAGCGASPAAGEPYPFRCPNAAHDDDTDHVLRRRLDRSAVDFPTAAGRADESPYVTYRGLYHAYHLGLASGMSDGEYVELVGRLDERIAAVDGHGFRVTPFARSDALSDRLGFGAEGGVWVKNETGNVSGSHKARHLFGLLVYLEVAERIGLIARAERPPLAIASCGNAALAAAVVAAAGSRRLNVYVPVDADPAVTVRLGQLGAQVEVCPRQPGVPGDPTYHRLRAAIATGSLPFTCQGNENGLAVEGGFTLGYEMATALAAHGWSGEAAPGSDPPLDRLIVQVGGGALASACFEALQEAQALGRLGRVPRLDAVQTLGAWPLRRAFERLSERLAAEPGPSDVDAALAYAARHRSEFMWPWEEEPRSIAHGILDDETYDWLAVVEGLLRTGGGAIVVDEDTLARANALAVEATGIDVDATGSSGLAGLIALRDAGEIGDGERVAVLFTGARR